MDRVFRRNKARKCHDTRSSYPAQHNHQHSTRKSIPDILFLWQPLIRYAPPRHKVPRFRARKCGNGSSNDWRDSLSDRPCTNWWSSWRNDQQARQEKRCCGFPNGRTCSTIDNGRRNLRTRVHGSLRACREDYVCLSYPEMLLTPFIWKTPTRTRRQT